MQNLNKERSDLKNKHSKKIFKLSSITNDENLVNLDKYLINEAKFYPSSTKEWMTSVYSYSKINFKSLPVKDKIVYSLLKSYFNLKQNKIKDVSVNANINIKNYSLSSFAKKRLKNKNLASFLTKANNLGASLYLLKQWKKSLSLTKVKLNKELPVVNEKNNQTSISSDILLSLDKISKNNKRYLLILKQRLLKKIRIQEKKKKLFLKKTYLSLPEIKHFNNKSIITVSIYNRNNQILKKKIYKLYKMFILKKNIKHKIISLANLKKINSSVSNQPIKNTVINSFKLSLYKKIYLNSKINSIISPKLLDSNLTRLFITIPDYPVSSISLANIDLKKINLRKLKKIQKILQKKYKKFIKYKYLMMLLCFYKFRLNNSNLLGLKNITRKIYGKKIVFRIINLKYMYLDSNILAEAITKKLRDRKKRIIRILKKVMENIKKVTLVKNLWLDNSILPIIDKDMSYNVLLNNVNNKIYSKTPITDLIDNQYFLNKSDEKQKNQLNGLILYSLNHKLVSGIKIQGSGRLTKRLTASRSITKARSKGSLKNINSSRNGLSNVMVRGYLKSNLQYVNINSYNRNGSFGVKSWISSC